MRGCVVMVETSEQHAKEHGFEFSSAGVRTAQLTPRFGDLYKGSHFITRKKIFILHIMTFERKVPSEK